ncbi:complex I subunit 4 family protein [Gorillibacterium massiliense]|uniref:complex I subunit 4 family protein n=1 Tax=Gorillibacterium massiliense TaxID=1280390 RepID=UPI0004B03331|nr:NADH-quinone oxidoreductase subunit M [Gorillibacterium massiliense]
MFSDWPILSLIAFSPLLGVLVLLFLKKDNGRWIKIVGVSATIIPLVLSALLYADFNAASSASQFVEKYDWLNIPLSAAQISEDITSFTISFQYHFAVDGLSMPFVFLTALIATMAALGSVYIKKRWKLYYILFLILETGMFGVFMAHDVFLFFLFFEAVLVPMFFLVGIWGYLDREKAAIKFLLYNGLGSAIMLLAFLILVTTAGFSEAQNASGFSIVFSGNLDTIMNNLFHNPDAYVNIKEAPFHLTAGLKTTLFAMFLVAFGIKLPIFPFHTWMLKVHQEAPPSIVMIHSGILLKMGAYGLIRFGILIFPEQAKDWAVALAILGVINILYGAVLAFVQTDFKLLLAYSSISHMGIVLLGIAAFNTTGLNGAVFQMVSHGLISALLFLLVGAIYERTKTTDLDQLGGLAANVPFIGGILLTAGMASLGLPGLSGFVGEFLSFLGLFDSMKWITVVGALGIIFAAVYMLRGVLGITFGPNKFKEVVMRDARLIEAVPMIILVAFILLLGLYPGILNHTLDHTVTGFDQHIQSILTAKAGE